MKNVVVYATRTCPYCTRAKALLDRKNIQYTILDVTDNPDLRLKMIELAGGRTSVPQIFIGDRHVGGSDDLHALEASGDLDKWLM